MADGAATVIPAIRIVAPEVEDIGYLSRRMRADEIEQWLALTGFKAYDPNRAAASIIATMGEVSFCLIDRAGSPIVAGGYEEVRPGVWQSWMVGTEDSWAKHWRAITKYAKSTMTTLLQSDRAHRVQTHALASRKAAHVWYARGLGMTYEGTHRAYFADGQDAVCYARVKEVQP